MNLTKSHYLVVALALVATLALVAPAWAPDDKPEKLIIGGGGYNTATQSFELGVSARFGIATGGEKADFTISATLVLRDATGNLLAELSGEVPVEKADPAAAPDADGLVALKPVIIPWGRLGGTVAGADVTAFAQLIGPSGRTIFTAKSKGFGFITL